MEDRNYSKAKGNESIGPITQSVLSAIVNVFTFILIYLVQTF